jgi:hypothetical protein
MTNKPQLTNADWIVTGHEIVAWINDVEFFDITFSDASQTFALRVNNAALAQTLYLGESSSLAEAMQRARNHINADDQDQLRCNHGRTLVESCRECGVEYT